MKNKILVACFFVSVMLLVSMASVVGVSDSSNDVEDDVESQGDTLEPREFKRAYIWGNLGGGTQGWEWDRGAHFIFEFTGTLNILELFPFKYQQIKAGLYGSVQGFYGLCHSTYFYPDYHTTIFGYVRLLHLN